MNSGVADGLRGKIGEMEKKRRGSYGVRQGESFRELGEESMVARE